MNNIELVKKAKKGDNDAFTQLYVQHANDLYRFALYYMSNPTDAEDAVQEALLSAYKALPNIRKESAFKSWLFKILSNTCKIMLIKRKERATGSLDDIIYKTADENTDVITELTLENALSKLKPEAREIVLLSVIGGYSSKEVGIIVGRKDSTVRLVLSRSLEKLREFMEE